MTETSWQFDTITGREDDVSNALIEMFEGDYNYFLAREILQNAIDAKDKSNDDPVKVVFSLENFSSSMFPGYQEFLKIFKSAKRFWPVEKEKCHVFLDNAIKCLEKDQIPVLKISDYNTIGLNGDDSDKNSPWYGLVKSVGSTTKHEGQGGSFGLGKGAPFAASYPRTLFYSTKNEMGQNVFQGVAEIVSHEDEDGNTKRGSGSFGRTQQRSIRDRRFIDEHMVRRERGLDIFIMGYKEEEDWQKKLLESVLRNFWPAIHDNLLTVEIDGFKVNRENLEVRLVEFYAEDLFKDGQKPEGNPLQFYYAFKKGKKYSEQLDNLGEVHFYFNRIEEPLNRVAMIRKSKMVIYTRDFRFHAPYAGVFICENDEGNRLLRKMESPRHDEWDKNRFKEKGNEINSELTDFIRNILRSLATQNSGGILEIPELHKYLPFNEEGDMDGNGKGGDGEKYIDEIGNEETSREIGAEENVNEDVFVTPYKVQVINRPASGHGGDGEIIRGGKKKLKKGQKAPGTGEGKANAIGKDELSTRIFLSKKDQVRSEYTIILKSKITGRCKLIISAVGEEGDEKTEIESAADEYGNRYASGSNSIYNVPLMTNSNLKLKVIVRTSIKLALKVVGYAL